MLQLIHNLFFRRKSRKLSPKVLGNGGLPGSIRTEYSSRSAFEKAQFGKYDLPFYKRTWFKIILWSLILSLTAWILKDTLSNFNIFS